MAVNPVMVYGPVLQDVSRAEQLNTSVKEVYDAFAGNHTTEELAGMPAYNVVDVRDGKHGAFQPDIVGGD